MTNLKTLMSLFNEYQIPYVDYPVYGPENLQTIFYPNFSNYTYYLQESKLQNKIIMERRIIFPDTLINSMFYSDDGLEFFKEIQHDWEITKLKKEMDKILQWTTGNYLLLRHLFPDLRHSNE